MKRTRLRRTGIRRRSVRRSGLSRSQRDELKDLHRTAVMLRVGAFLFNDEGRKQWRGYCEWCRKEAWLQVCHIEPQGAYPHMKYDEDNAWAGCYSCHLGPKGWHKNPLPARDWIVAHIGMEQIKKLGWRARNPKRIDYDLTKIHLLQRIKDAHP